MKSVFRKILFISLFSIFINNVYAANLSKDCGKSIDPTDMAPGSMSAANTKLIYDLTYLTVKDNKMYLLGWVFINGRETVDPKPNIYFEDTKTKKKVPFNVVLATPSNASCGFKGCDNDPSRPKYYDLSYWNCARQNLTAGNRCLSGSFKVLKGGFSASIDLDSLEESKTYEAYINYKGFTKKLALVKSNVDTNVINNSTITIETENSKKIIDIKKMKFQDQVKMVADYGRLNGPSGFHCDSVIAAWAADTGNKNYKPASTYFNWQSGHNLFDLASSQQIKACRGGNVACNHSSGNSYAAGDILMYHLKVNRNNVKTFEGKIPDSWTNGTWSSKTGATAYAPASWLEFEGSITVEVKAEKKEPPQEEPPNACAGKEYYSIYYLFSESGITSGLIDVDGKKITKTQSFNPLADQKILSQVLKNQSGGELSYDYVNVVPRGQVQVVADEEANLEKLKMSISQYYNVYGEKYNSYKDGVYIDSSKNAIYVKHNIYQGYKKVGSSLEPSNEWKSCIPGTLVNHGTPTDPKFDQSVYDKIAGCATAPLGNAKNLEEYKSLAIKPVDIKIELSKITGEDNTLSSNGHIITRNYGDGKKFYLITDTKQEHPITKLTSNYYQPAVYRVDICEKDNNVEEPNDEDCSDTTTPATCEGSHNGIFKENDNLKTCTLKSPDSGFQIVENSYCTVACKDDISADFPGKKYTKSGRYFTLDDSTPHVQGKRTCVTDRINYNKYDTDLQNAGNESIRQYNTYKDYEDRENDFRSNYSTVDKEDKGCCDWDEFGVCTAPYSYTYTEWTVSSRSKRQNSVADDSDFSEKTGLYGGQTGTCVNKVPEPVPVYNSLPSMASSMAQKKESYKSTYKNSVKSYTDIINSYASCFSWTDSTPRANYSGDMDYSIATTDTSETYKYGFNPSVTFNYFDEDNKFGNPYKYEGLQVKGGISQAPSVEYWDKDSGEIDKYYKNSPTKQRNGYGGMGAIKTTPRQYLHCNGSSTCTWSNVKEDLVYKDTAYIKRTEEADYTYHLPSVYTIVPSGAVTLDGKETSNPKIKLSEDAVPVNINTPHIDPKTGNNFYNYYISITNVADSLRKTYELNLSIPKQEDNFEARVKASGAFGYYNGSAETDGYVCQYEVENEIYTPPNNGKGLGQFNFFYRPVDPYDIKHPNNIPLGYNWTDARAGNEEDGTGVRGQMRKDANNYQVMVTPTDTHDVFKFKLTPTVMKQIRSFNGKQSATGNSFADFNLTCYDKDDTKGYHCYSPFLTCLAGGDANQDGKAPGINSCHDIFEDSLKSYEYKEGYTLKDLNDNRNTLIKKQNGLDSLGEGT